VIIGLALETEDFSTSALNTFNVEIVDFDTVSTVNSSAKLVIAMNGRELLADDFFVGFDEFSFEWVELL
jgi:hypothetical protein